MVISKMNENDAMELQRLRLISKQRKMKSGVGFINWGLSENSIFKIFPSMCLSAVGTSGNLQGGLFVRRSQNKFILGPLEIKEEYREKGIGIKLVQSAIEMNKREIVTSTRVTSNSLIRFGMKIGSNLWKNIFFFAKNIFNRDKSLLENQNNIEVIIYDLSLDEPPKEDRTFLSTLDLLKEIEMCKSIDHSYLLNIFQDKQLIAFAIIRIIPANDKIIALVHRLGLNLDADSTNIFKSALTILENFALDKMCHTFCLWVDAKYYAFLQTMIQKNYRLKDYQLGMGYRVTDEDEMKSKFLVINDFR
jgi:hypothetical protein